MAKNEGAVQAPAFTFDNVIGRMVGSVLHLEIDTSKRLRPSRPTMNKDGTVNPPKSTIIGTTGGNKGITLPDGALAKLGITLYVPNQAEQAE